MGRDDVWSSLGAGTFRIGADGTIDADEVIAVHLDQDAVAVLRELATDAPTEVPLSRASARVRRDGEDVVGVIIPRASAREVELRGILEHTAEGVLLHREGTIVDANASAARILGAAGPAELAGAPVPEALREAEPGVEVRLGPGPDRLVEITRTTLRYDGRDTELLLLTDLTERRLLSARLTQTDRLATVGMLAASIAHEVNNPLTYVMNYVERLERDLETMADADPAGRAGKLLERAKAAAEGCHRVRDIVRDLKTFARVEESDDVPIDVNRALRSALQMAGHQVRARARLVIDLGALPAVRANDGRLCQVFLNLLLNAAQAIDPSTNKREQRVEVRSWTDGGLVHVSIEDTGSGIDAAALPRLFEPFFTTKPGAVGTGLGLWICREIVEELHGHIHVDTTAGEGTTMTVILPVAPSDAIHISSLPPAPDSAATTIGRLRRVLVIDDEPALRELLAEALGEHADVTTASSGYEARELLEHDPEFDAILCDVMMPGMGGDELYAWLDRALPTLARRMIFMTGASHSRDVREFLARVDNERLDKPFRVRDVERLLDRVIHASLRVHA